MKTGVTIKGLDKLVTNLDDKRLLAKPLGNFFNRSALAVQKQSRKRTPVDTGQLRQAIDIKVDTGKIPTWAKVGVLGAPFGTSMGYKAFSMEYGTGLFAEGENAKGRRYFPPPAALDRWASRHGFPDGRTVAFIIWKKGGLKPRRYMRDGFKAAKPAIRQNLKTLAKDIERRYTA